MWKKMCVLCLRCKHIFRTLVYGWVHVQAIMLNAKTQTWKRCCFHFVVTSKVLVRQRLVCCTWIWELLCSDGQKYGFSTKLKQNIKFFTELILSHLTQNPCNKHTFVVDEDTRQKRSQNLFHSSQKYYIFETASVWLSFSITQNLKLKCFNYLTASLTDLGQNLCFLGYFVHNLHNF